jgi:hypothetical protein
MGSCLVPLVPEIEETARTLSPMIDDESRSARRVHSLTFIGVDRSEIVSCDFVLEVPADVLGGCESESSDLQILSEV